MYMNFTKQLSFNITKLKIFVKCVKITKFVLFDNTLNMRRIRYFKIFIRTQTSLTYF